MTPPKFKKLFALGIAGSLFLLSAPASAGNIILPVFTDSISLVSKRVLVLENSGSRGVVFTVLGFEEGISNPTSSRSLNVDPGELKKIPILDVTNGHEAKWLMLKPKSSGAESVTARFESNEEALFFGQQEIALGANLDLSMLRPKSNNPIGALARLEILNIGDGANLVQIEAINDLGLVLSRHQFNLKSRASYGVENLFSLINPAVSRLKIIGTRHLLAWASIGVSASETKVQMSRPGDSTTATAGSGGGSYFLIGSPTYGVARDSFIIRLQDQKMIDQARSIAMNPRENQKVLIAKVAAVLPVTDFNRNWNSPLKARWSWEVSSAIEFADFASIDCDVSPRDLEDFRDLLLASRTNFCFWGMTVLREVEFGVNQAKSRAK